MEILSLEKHQVISSLTLAELEVVVTQLVQRVLSTERESFMPIQCKQEVPFDSTATPFWQIVLDNSNQVSEEIWDSIPEDASENLDAYLYGN